MIINFDTGDLGSVARKVWSVNLGKTLDKSIRKSIILLERVAKTETPVDTGTLRNSYETQFSFLEGRLRNFREYAPFVHDGHRQTPGRFVPAIGRRLVASFVKGNPFMQRTADKTEKDVVKIFEDDIDEMVKAVLS